MNPINSVVLSLDLSGTLPWVCVDALGLDLQSSVGPLGLERFVQIPPGKDRTIRAQSFRSSAFHTGIYWVMLLKDVISTSHPKTDFISLRMTQSGSSDLSQPV